MKTTTLTDEEMWAIASQDESHFFDVKQFDVSGKALQKVAVAFANADGGEVVIGIRDKVAGGDLDARWEGIEDIEKLNGHLQALFEIARLDIRYELLKRQHVSGYALRIIIEKGAQVVATSSGAVFQRQGAQSLPIQDPERIQQLGFAKGAVSFEDVVLADLPPEQIVEAPELTSFLGDYSPKTDALDFLIN